jgi:dTDP-4-dehydrorhamnose 3,5-epimerase
MFIPKGFAHGFVVLSEWAIFGYLCSDYYHKENERGIIWNDKTLNIDWYIDNGNKIILSNKDKNLPTVK